MSEYSLAAFSVYLLLYDARVHQRKAEGKSSEKCWLSISGRRSSRLDFMHSFFLRKQYLYAYHSIAADCSHREAMLWNDGGYEGINCSFGTFQSDISSSSVCTWLNRYTNDLGNGCCVCTHTPSSVIVHVTILTPRIGVVKSEKTKERTSPYKHVLVSSLVVALPFHVNLCAFDSLVHVVYFGPCFLSSQRTMPKHNSYTVKKNTIFSKFFVYFSDSLLLVVPCHGPIPSANKCIHCARRK